MNTKRLLIFVVVAFILVLAYLAARSPEVTRPSNTEEAAANTVPMEKSDDKTSRGPITPSSSPRSHDNPLLTNDLRRKELIREYQEQLHADPASQFTRPLLFFGKVLDQDDKPLPDANVSFRWNRVNAASTAMETGSSETNSDSNGIFSLWGQTGNQLTVKITKANYYNVPANPLTFEYADPAQGNFYTPDSQSPVIFHLRKRGQSARLITSQNGMRTNVKLGIPKDGMPVYVDFFNQRAAEAGPLQISQIKPSNVRWQDATQWSFQLKIPDGGLVEYHDDFPFEAPINGYQPVVNLDFQNGQTNWASGIKKDYFFRFGNPSVYGRMTLETDFDEPGARITYAINPDGSRNLEPQ